MSFSLIVMRAGVCRLAEFKQDFKRQNFATKVT